MEKVINGLHIKIQNYLKIFQDAPHDRKLQHERFLDLEQAAQKALKDFKSANSIHRQVVSDLTRVLASARQIQYSNSKDTPDLNSHITLIGQIFSIFKARNSLSSIYINLSMYETIPNYAEAAKSLESLKTHVETSFNQPTLLPIQKHILLEIDLFYKLLIAQNHISQLRFLESVLWLQHCKFALLTFKSFLQQLVSTNQLSMMSWGCIWLNQFYSLLVAKSGVYFYEVLKKNEEQTGSDSKQALSFPKSDVNFYSLIETFCSRTDAFNVSLIVNTQKLGNEYDSNGYNCHPNDYEFSENVPTGLKSWPATFSYPNAPPMQHWPNIISVIFESEEKLNRYREIVVFFDKKVLCTYYLIKVDPSVIMVVIYEKKKENENIVKDSLYHITNTMRLFKLVDQLK